MPRSHGAEASPIQTGGVATEASQVMSKLVALARDPLTASEDGRSLSLTVVAVLKAPQASLR